MLGRSAFAGAIVAPIALAASASASTAQVRVIHASPDAPPVDVWVDGAPAITDLGFATSSGYAALPGDTYNVQVVPAGLTEPVVIDADLAVENGTSYTVLAVGRLADIEPLVLVDDNTLDAENARVRFVHASPNAPAVDIALAGGGPVLFPDVEFKESGGYIAVPGGTYELEVRLAGTETVALTLPPLTFDANRVYSAVAVGLVGEEPALTAILEQDASATANVRIVHASPDAPAVDALVNDAVAFENASFTDVTGYAALPFDTYNLKIVPTGATKPVVLEADVPFEAGIDYTVLAVNVLSAIEPLVLVDDNTTDAANARIRFVHLSPGAPAVDIALAGGAVLFPDVEFKESGGYIAVPGGTYDLEARLAGTETVVLDLPGIAVANDTVYTAYAMGAGPEDLQAVISVDALTCSGDANGDGNVDVHDLLVVLGAWGSNSLEGDLDGSGTVDVLDLLLVLGGWGPCA